MSSSKFAGLEGVEFNTPDVYETRSPSPSRKRRGHLGGRQGGYGSSDDDDSDSNDDGSFGHSPSSGRKNKKIGQGHSDQVDASPNGVADNDIVRKHIDADAAAQRFRDATEVTSKDVDFTSSIHRRRKEKQAYYPRTAATFETDTYLLGSGTGYRIANDELYENGDDADTQAWVRVQGSESVIDRFRRLRFETEELERNLQQDADVPSSTNTKLDSNVGLLTQSRLLRDHLARLQDNVESSDALQRSDAVRWQSEAKSILAKLDSNGKESDAIAKTASSDNANTVKSAEESSLRTDLDRRLKGLESLVGVASASQDEAKALPRPLLPALARIEHLLTLLTQPRHLDGISRRVKVLVSELERAHEARRRLMAADGNHSDKKAVGGEGPDGVSLSKESVARLNTVLPVLSRIESTLPIIPSLLSRLQSLSSLHTSSASISNDVETMEGALRTSVKQAQDMTDMLNTLESTIEQNQQRTKDNLSSIQERIDHIVKRMDSLTS